MTPRNRDAPISHPDRFFVGGEWLVPRSDARIDVIQPATEEVYATVVDASAEDMDSAIAAAREAFDHGPWPRMTPAQRAGYLTAIGDEIVRRADDFSHTWTSEMGILHSAARATIPGIGSAWQGYAGLADEFEFVERHEPQNGMIRLLAREPVGVVGAIIPWNGPLPIITHKAAPALLAGCTLVVKMSPEAPGAGYVMAEVADAVGLPPGVLNVVTADRQVSEQLVSDPRVDKIAFTGSTATGRRIASLCAERVARYTLELGGKSAAVVLDDYDPAQAADTISAAARRMTGQVCSSLTRVIIDRARHDELAQALAESFAEIRVGDPFEESTDMGPLAMRRQLEKVERFIASGIESGAKLLTGGERPSGLSRGYFIEPTVFADVDPRSEIAQEEIFGPVLCVIAADNDEHAVHIANDTIYGLNASVFTNDSDRAYQVSRALRSGTVGHNAQRADYGLAFGGFKQSGVGREGGREGLLSYLETKAIILNGEPTQLV